MGKLVGLCGANVSNNSACACILDDSFIQVTMRMGANVLYTQVYKHLSQCLWTGLYVIGKGQYYFQKLIIPFVRQTISNPTYF